MENPNGAEIATAGFNDLLSSVLELIESALRIESTLHDKIKASDREEDEEDIFVYCFLTRMEEIAASVILVSKGAAKIDGKVFGSKIDRFADAALLVRSALEGMWGFRAFMKDSSKIAERWRLYTIYENYRRQLRIEKINDDATAPTVARQWLIQRYSAQDIKKAEGNFDFDDSRQNWYDHSAIPRLANSFCDELIRSVKYYHALDSKERSELLKGCKKLHAIAYGDFSRITHWSPSGIGGTSPLGSLMNENMVDIRFLPAIVFQSLFMMAKYANDRYHLCFEKKLNHIFDRYAKKNEMMKLV